MLTLEIPSAEVQEALGGVIATLSSPGCTIYLEGDLGAGKTTLVRGFLRGLGHKGSVKSPTYTLMEPYELPGGCCCHFDLYRLADPGELEYLGLRDLLRPDVTLLVEWPERGAGELPDADLILRIQHRPKGRRIAFEPVTEQGKCLAEALQRVRFAPSRETANSIRF